MPQDFVGNTVAASSNVNMNTTNSNLQDIIREMDMLLQQRLRLMQKQLEQLEEISLEGQLSQRRRNSEFEEEYNDEVDDEQATMSRHFDILLLECRRQPSSLCYRCCVDLLALSSPPLSWGSRHPIILALSATELGCLNGLGVRSGGSWSSGPIVREPNRRPTLKLS
ncbi:hypothetical protein V6N12_076425 [Hibiscus sabdariffa]|uniref:Uncharacterized protein n=1 Tax=Hibiscus sabdariffa TaxID=183260 RepID=A0ABR2DAN7_9ROSI